MENSITQAAESTVDAAGSSSGASSVYADDMSIDWDAIIKEYDDEFDQEVDHIRRLMPRLVGQLVHGCGDSKCKKSQCATGARNATRAPTRNYSPRSARIVAFALLSRPDPDAYLCEYYEARMQSDSTESGERPEPEEGPKDPTSLTQLMADTDCFKRLAKGEHVESLTRQSVDPISLRVAAITRKLQKYHERPFLDDQTINPRFARNQEVADVLAAALSLFYDMLPDNDHPSDWQTLAYYVNHGRATPSQGHEAGPGLADVDALLRAFDSDQNVRLCAEICKVVALRTQVEDVMVKPRRHSLGTGGLLTYVANHVDKIARARTADKLSKRTDETTPWVPWPYPLWFKKAFIRDWDGSPIVKRGSIACGALELLEMQQWIWNRWHPTRTSDANLLPYVFKKMNLTEAMRSWATQNPPLTTISRHLLSFPFLFTPSQILLYFRMQNHLRMREANKQAHVYEDIFDRHVATSDAASVEWDARSNEVQHLRDFYLLVTIRRDRIIQDAFDQLWQRRKCELVKPLRVRLGEMEGHEVGQDLGGVQIEFFNLICTAIFAEDNGMFSTDAITGLSTIRPGSLQPLYMFELFGLILALALHNGIPIPVNFPLVFYKQLLDQPYGSLDDLEEAWPTVTRSLRAINEGAHEGLDCEFPLEANGLRISVDEHTIADLQSQLALQQHTDKPQPFTLQTTETTPLANPTSNPPPSPLSWPGWTVLPPSPSTPPPTPLTPQNTPAYTRDYAHWLTTLSVLPQLLALTRGLHTLLPPSTLALHTPSTLRSTLQGTPHLSLPALRSATHYEHYAPSDPYIASFWRILSRWPEKDQRALLKFVTAAERIPITGAGALTFKIAGAERLWDTREEDENELLPTSSTCFGTLYLPRYRDEETLERRLRVAVEFGGVGFGVA